MIIKTLSIEEMINDLICDEYANWSPQGARALAEYWEQLSDDLGEDLTWDRVAMRCDFTEYASWDDALSEYGFSLSKPEQLMDQTVVIPFGDNRLIVRNF